MSILEIKQLARRFGDLTAAYGIGVDFLVLIVVAAILIYIASRAYPHVVT